MCGMTRPMLAGAAVIAALAVSPAFAQQPQTQRVRGTIEKVEGSDAFGESRATAARSRSC